MEKGWDKVGGRICLLGKANVCPEGGEAIPWGAKRETQLLALLLLERGDPVPRSTMRAELWEPRSDDGLLKPAISRLRTKMLEAGLPEIPKGTSTIRIALPTGWSVHCLEAEDALEEARGEREPPAAWAAVKQTIEALEREFLEGAFETPFLARARPEFAQLLHEARLLACDIAIREGADPKWQGQAIRTAAVAIHERPEEEGPYAAMVRLRIAAGQQREAIEYCEDFERENGLLESGEIFELKAKAQRHLAREENPPALLLLTLSRADEDSDFVGRDPLLEVLGDALDKLLGERFVGRALCGEKGVGKSRLAREFAVFAHQRGCTVISASAALKPSEEGVPCQPLITAIRNWVMHAEPSLRALVDPNALGNWPACSPRSAGISPSPSPGGTGPSPAAEELGHRGDPGPGKPAADRADRRRRTRPRRAVARSARRALRNPAGQPDDRRHRSHPRTGRAQSSGVTTSSRWMRTVRSPWPSRCWAPMPEARRWRSWSERRTEIPI